DAAVRLLCADRGGDHRDQHAVRLRPGAHEPVRPAQRPGRLGAGAAGHVPVHRGRDRADRAGEVRDQPAISGLPKERRKSRPPAVAPPPCEGRGGSGGGCPRFELIRKTLLPNPPLPSHPQFPITALVIRKGDPRPPTIGYPLLINHQSPITKERELRSSRLKPPPQRGQAGAGSAPPQRGKKSRLKRSSIAVPPSGTTRTSKCSVSGAITRALPT